VTAQPDSTCWTVIQAAAAGSPGDRQGFARRYGPVVRAYLAARWCASPCRRELDDAVQDVFVECFKQGGVLARADRDRPGGFWPFLYGVVRHVALRMETARVRERPPPSDAALDQIADSDASLSRVFDRAWAKGLLRQAAERQAVCARQAGEAALTRVELLRLRFHEGLPIHEIARRWGVEPASYFFPAGTRLPARAARVNPARKHPALRFIIGEKPCRSSVSRSRSCCFPHSRSLPSRTRRRRRNPRPLPRSTA
jgi:RNA polymerase sigma-70 factor (ECF subfamily)